MSIRQKFNEYKQEVKEIYQSRKYDKLELMEKSTRELIDSGYLNRKVESFMFFNEFSFKEIDEFFKDFCRDVCIFQQIMFPVSCFEIPAQDFIENLKFLTVCYVLCDELSNFVAMMKNECITNN